MKNRFFAKIKESRSLRILLVLCGAILFYMTVKNFSVVQGLFSDLMKVLSPLIAGAIIAYLVLPAVRFFETKLFGGMKRRIAAHIISVFITLILLLALIALFLIIVVPSFLNSLRFLLDHIGEYVAGFEAFAEKNGISFMVPQLDEMNLADLNFEIAGKHFVEWIIKTGDGIFKAASSVGGRLVNSFIALMFALYILLDNVHLSKSFSRYFRSIMEPETYERVDELVGRGNRIFMRFFAGNLLDALLIGILCYIFMLVAKLPFTVLIAVVVGVTNFVPTFGPIIGCAFGTVLLLFVHPVGALWFIIYELVSQTVDGYIIKPVLFGDTTGLKPLWVLTAIIVGGGLFGIPGMILGVPFVALLATIIRERTAQRLRKRGYPDEIIGIKHKKDKPEESEDVGSEETEKSNEA